MFFSKFVGLKQLTIHIPEHKFQFVMELLRSLNFIKIEKPAEEKFTLTNEQKGMVNDELRKIDENPNYLLDWDTVKHTIFAD